MLAGVDLGASLHKIALASDPALGDLELATFPAREREHALAFVRARAPTRAVLMGGTADAAAVELAPVLTSVVTEFDAWARGATLLAARAGAPIAEPYLLVSVGTGTSILLVEEGRTTRIAGTALGGGTILGLGSLLLGLDRFDELVGLAARGSRTEVDLLLGDVYPDIPVPDFTAAHFGKVRSRRPEDVAHALVRLVGENVALMASGQALARGVAGVVYGGSTLIGNGTLADVLTIMTGYFGLRVVLLAEGSHCGAVGCLSLAFEAERVTME
jgi:type II pantothenate kinase